MIRMLCIAAVPAIVLAACAPMETAVDSASGSATQYCWKDRLIDDGKSLSCNWAANRADACEAVNVRSIAKAATASAPESAGRCNNGQWLVRVTTK